MDIQRNDWTNINTESAEARTDISDSQTKTRTKVIKIERSKANTCANSHHTKKVSVSSRGVHADRKLSTDANEAWNP